jgi:hypothetical protein
LPKPVRVPGCVQPLADLRKASHIPRIYGFIQLIEVSTPVLQIRGQEIGEIGRHLGDEVHVKAPASNAPESL